MVHPEVVLIIGTDGTLSLEGRGFQGPACDKAMREIAEALGELTQVTKKPEYQAKVALRVRELQ